MASDSGKTSARPMDRHSAYVNLHRPGVLPELDPEAVVFAGVADELAQDLGGPVRQGHFAFDRSRPSGPMLRPGAEEMDDDAAVSVEIVRDQPDGAVRVPALEIRVAGREELLEAAMSFFSARPRPPSEAADADLFGWLAAGLGEQAAARQPRQGPGPAPPRHPPLRRRPRPLPRRRR